MNKLLTRGGIEFIAVFLGIALSFNVEEWREDAQIKNRLKSDYINIKKDLEKVIFINDDRRRSFCNQIKIVQS